MSAAPHAVAAPPLADGFVTDALSGIAQRLDVPVHVLVLVALAALAYEVGRGLLEIWRRVKPGTPGVERLALRVLDAPQDADLLARAAPSRLTERALVAFAETARTTQRPADRAKGFEKALTRYELDVQRRLDRTRMLVRAGPALGLMGTLIPLAPGLAALGKGDIAQLAEDMQVAFAATVIGLVVGTLGFALTLARTRVYTEDLTALESALEAHAEGTGGGGGPGAPGDPAPPSGPQEARPLTEAERATGWIGRPVHHGPSVEPSNGHRPDALPRLDGDPWGPAVAAGSAGKGER